MSVYTDSIKQALQQRQMSQRELARRIGVSVQYVTDVFMDRRQFGFVPAQQIHNLLGVSLDLWSADRGKVPDDLRDKFGTEGLAKVFEQLRKETV